MIFLKMSFDKLGLGVWTNYARFGRVPAAGSCDLNTETSGLIKGWTVLPEGLSVQKTRDPCS